MKAKCKAYFLIRDKDGRPKIDGNPADLPDLIKELLTPEEMKIAIKEYLDAHA